MTNEDSSNDKEGLCPKVAIVNKEILDLDYDKKLQVVEEEAKSLYSFCQQKGFSNEELQACMSKFSGPEKPITRKALEDSTKSFVYLSVVVAMVACIYQSSFLYNLIIVHWKIGMVTYVLPYWDWASLYREDCLITNTFLPVRNTTYNKKTCMYCINVVKYGENIIDRLNNTQGEEITKHYIENYQPVVVTDTLKTWTGKPALNMDELARLYQTDPSLSTAMGSCMYSTNVGFNQTFYDFITAYVDKQLPDKWHIIWQNCDSKAAKVIRKYYTRPYFLPGMAQAGIENTLIAAKGKHVEEQFDVILTSGSSGHWITVVSGSLEVNLSPYAPCMEKFECKVADVHLEAGETLFFTDDVWVAKYSVTSDDMIIAIASSVIWDEMY